MSWIEIHITASADNADLLSDQLTLLGAEAVTFQDAGNEPLYEPAPDTARIWKETIVIGLFNQQQALDPIVAYLENQRIAGSLKQFIVKKVAEEDWVRRSLDQFQPLKFGSRLWICPSWITPPDLNQVNVILDPGLAFGTGTHPTTALCLAWLDAHIQAQNCVIDYGCGSGILAVSALKLGAKQVFAVDHDPQALESTLRNGEQNQFYPPILKTYLPAELPAIQADLLMANILAQPLMELASTFAQLIKPGGKIILSGILANQVPLIRSIYSAWFTLQDAVYKEEWALLAATRSD